MKKRTDARTAIKATPKAPAPIRRGLTPPEDEEEATALSDAWFVGERTVVVSFNLGDGPGIVLFVPLFGIAGGVTEGTATPEGAAISFLVAVQQIAFVLAVQNVVADAGFVNPRISNNSYHTLMESQYQQPGGIECRFVRRHSWNIGRTLVDPDKPF